jgi:hypothetical protein
VSVERGTLVGQECAEGHTLTCLVKLEEIKM